MCICAASQSTDNTFAAPRVADNPRIATNTSGCAFALSFPLAAVPALSAQPPVVAKASSVLPPAPSAPSL